MTEADGFECYVEDGVNVIEMTSKPDATAQEAADRIEELERQLGEAREANRQLHRRVQTAEGKLQRMEAAHEDACRIAFTKSIDYHLYASVLLNCNQGLFPKLVNKGGVVSDAATVVRNQALEEAAIKIDGLRDVLSRSDGEILHARAFIKDLLRDLSAAIRALSHSTPTPLQEQNANSGKEGE
jgi:hypothetical protein